MTQVYIILYTIYIYVTHVYDIIYNIDTVHRCADILNGSYISSNAPLYSLKSSFARPGAASAGVARRRARILSSRVCRRNAPQSSSLRLDPALQSKSSKSLSKRRNTKTKTLKEPSKSLRRAFEELSKSFRRAFQHSKGAQAERSLRYLKRLWRASP